MLDNKLYNQTNKVSQNNTQKLEKQIEINEEDLFTYYLQKNMWVKGILFEDFINTLKSKGVKVL